MPISIVSSPSITTTTTTSDQWAALLRYDASRRNSTGSSSATAVGRQQLHHNCSSHRESALTPTVQLPEQQSLGDDLPHMPEELHPAVMASSTLTHTDNIVDDGDEMTHYDDATIITEVRPRLEGIATPSVYKGENAVLVDRELNRLRHRREKATKRFWRILTGTSMLPVLGLCSYVLAQYVLAFLSLSPSNWFLSDSATGTRSSPDPLLRILALIGVCAAGVSALGAVASGFYLRFSRQKSSGTWIVWFAAILSAITNVALCIVNLALIAIWHRKYAASPNDSFAATRDVSLRCNGVWDLDILWSAAKSSPVAKSDSDTVSTCTHDNSKTLEAYLIAGGVRLALFVIFCSLWLFCLARYNQTLAVVDYSDGYIAESAEMHKLLEEEGRLSSLPAFKEDDFVIPGRYSYGYEDEKGDIRTGDDLAYNPVAAHPRSDLSNWQHDGTSHFDDNQGAEDYGITPIQHYGKAANADPWSAGIVGHVWNAFWGPEDMRRDALQEMENNKFSGNHCAEEGGIEYVSSRTTPSHEKQPSRLGVRSWFQHDGSGPHSEDYGGEDWEQDGRILGCPPTRYTRTPSQEGREIRDRHVAVRQAHPQVEAGQQSLVSRSQTEATAREEGDWRKRDQQDRIDFLAKLSYQEKEQHGEGSAHDGNVRPTRPEDVRQARHSTRHSSLSAGDELPHMPELLSLARHDQEEDETDYWTVGEQEAESRDEVQESSLYVRTLGKLVHKLSAIESVGSKEWAERVSRSDRSASDLY
ncbi:hypothetical protein CBS101457_001363 [Exobasidium rhododendri]|nr:hypothetical protein CBS101457_001363 [Exobasidium rhododendri]